MSDGILGYGATLSVGGTTAGNIISISGPNQVREAVDYSNCDSASKWREKLPGMLDSGELTFEVNYDGASGGTANDLAAMLAATAVSSVVVTWVDTSSWTCNGMVTGLSGGLSFDDKVTQSVTVATTGVPSYLDVA